MSVRGLIIKIIVPYWGEYVKWIKRWLQAKENCKKNKVNVFFRALTCAQQLYYGAA
jgi:hypothetical protein